MSSSDSSSDEPLSSIAARLKLPHDCQKYADVKNHTKTVKDIQDFCVLLRGNKVKAGKEAFLKLPFVVQCLFLHHSWDILSHKSKHSDESYMTAFLLFKLFRSKEMKGSAIYKRYAKLKSVEKKYKNALTFKRSAKGSKVSTAVGGKTPGTRRARKEYDKEYQRYEAPKHKLDSLYLFYTSLYASKPKSRLAVTWLTEHGVFDGTERKRLIKLYEKYKKDGKLIR